MHSKIFRSRHRLTGRCSRIDWQLVKHGQRFVYALVEVDWNCTDLVQTFRSLPGPNAGILDAEFEAFQAGRPFEAPYPEPQLFSDDGPSTSFQSGYQQHQPPFPSWASDFQNLRIEEARSSPISSAQFHQQAPLHRSLPAGWHEDFLRQQNQSPPYQQRSYMSSTDWAYGYTGGLLPQQDAQQKQLDRQVDEVFDEAAFERAFEVAKSDVQSQHQETQLDQDLYRTEEAGATLKGPEIGDPLNHLVGSDRVFDEPEQKGEKINEEADADELARTAGQLLENVKGNQSQKFQESSFLALMRQLRDKEVRVEGDKLVDVSMPSSA